MQTFSTTSAIDNLKAGIRAIPDFPQAGVIFRDITPALADSKLLHLMIDLFIERYKNQHIDKIVAIDARGFILGAALAYALNIGFVPVRKLGKLPADTFSEKYDLEYGSNTLEIHKDSLLPGQRVIIIDDVLATGGTASATTKLVEKAGGHVVELAFLLELSALQGRRKLADRAIYVAINY